MERKLDSGVPVVADGIKKIAKKVAKVLGAVAVIGGSGLGVQNLFDAASEQVRASNLASDIMAHRSLFLDFLDVQTRALEALSKDEVLTPKTMPVRIHASRISSPFLALFGLGQKMDESETFNASRFVAAERSELTGEIWLGEKGNLLIFRIPGALTWSKANVSAFFVIKIEEDEQKKVTSFKVGHLGGAMAKIDKETGLEISNPDHLASEVDLKEYPEGQLGSEEWQDKTLKILTLLRQLEAKEESLSNSRNSNVIKEDAKDLDKTLLNGTVRIMVNRSNGIWVRCSGFIVAPDTLVTAGHCTADVGENNAALLYSVESYVPTRGKSVAFQPVWSDGSSGYVISTSKDKDISVVVFDGKIFPAKKALKIASEAVSNDRSYVFGHLVFDNKFNFWKEERGNATAIITPDGKFSYEVKFDFGVERGNSGGPVANIRGEVVSLASIICEYDQKADNGKLCGPRITAAEVEQMAESGRAAIKRSKK